MMKIQIEIDSQFQISVYRDGLKGKGYMMHVVISRPRRLILLTIDLKNVDLPLDVDSINSLISAAEALVELLLLEPVEVSRQDREQDNAGNAPAAAVRNRVAEGREVTFLHEQSPDSKPVNSNLG